PEELASRVQALSRRPAPIRREARPGMTHLNQRNDRLAADRRLWVSVLVQAIEDATNPTTVTTAGRRKLVMRDAREWLTKPSRDLEAVCGMAGVEMDRFIVYAKTKIEAF